METIDGRKIKVISGGMGYSVQVQRGDGGKVWETVGEVRKRAEIFTGMRRGGTYYYWDATAADGQRVVRYTWACLKCGGKVHNLRNEESGGFSLPTCLACGHVHRASEREFPITVDGAQLTADRDRDAKLGANTRRDAVAALLKALGIEVAS